MLTCIRFFVFLIAAFELEATNKEFNLVIIIFFVCFRCADIGKFSMTGSNVRSCIHSEWSGSKPACFGLNQENDYASKLFESFFLYLLIFNIQCVD